MKSTSSADPPVVIFLVPGCITETDILGSWVLNLWSMWGRPSGNCSPFHPQPRWQINNNMTSQDGGMVEISVVLQDLKIGDSITFPFNSSVWPLEKQDASQGITADFQENNQVLVPAAVTTSEVYLC